MKKLIAQEDVLDALDEIRFVDCAGFEHSKEYWVMDKGIKAVESCELFNLKEHDKELMDSVLHMVIAQLSPCTICKQPCKEQSMKFLCERKYGVSLSEIRKVIAGIKENHALG